MKIIAFRKLIFTKILWKTVLELCFSLYVLKYRKYYKHIDYLPLFNFAEIMKGNFNYLYIKKQDRKYPKVAFAKIFEAMNFQFKYLDNKGLRQRADLADYEHKYLTADNKKDKNRWLNEYNTLKNKINKKKNRPFDLNAFTDYIEHTFKFAPGSIDPKKISTSKAFMNYQKAIEHNKKAK